VFEEEPLKNATEQEAEKGRLDQITVLAIVQRHIAFALVLESHAGEGGETQYSHAQFYDAKKYQAKIRQIAPFRTVASSMETGISC